VLRIVCVGAGWFANHVHGPALAQYRDEHPDEVDLAAVCVRKSIDKAQEYCRKFGFQRVYTDLDEMLDSERPDACWIVTPISATRGVAARVMERGVAAFIEKPPGANLVEARELAEVARRTGTPHMVAFNRRWAPCTRKALEWLPHLETVEYVCARMLRPDRMDEQFAFGTGIHLFDCIRFLAQRTCGGVRAARTRRVESAAGEASGKRVLNFEVDIECANGARGRCDLLPACGKYEESYAFYGPRASVAFQLPGRTRSMEVPGRADLWVEGELRESEAWPTNPEHVTGGIYAEAVEFVTALQEGRPPSPSVEETVDSAALAEAVQEGRDIELCR
jgi:predicted dehydrogenase